MEGSGRGHATQWAARGRCPQLSSARVSGRRRRVPVCVCVCLCASVCVCVRLCASVCAALRCRAAEDARRAGARETAERGWGGAERFPTATEARQHLRLTDMDLTSLLPPGIVRPCDLLLTAVTAAAGPLLLRSPLPFLCLLLPSAIGGRPRRLRRGHFDGCRSEADSSAERGYLLLAHVSLTATATAAASVCVCASIHSDRLRAGLISRCSAGTAPACTAPPPLPLPPSRWHPPRPLPPPLPPMRRCPLCPRWLWICARGCTRMPLIDRMQRPLTTAVGRWRRAKCSW